MIHSGGLCRGEKCMYTLKYSITVDQCDKRGIDNIVYIVWTSSSEDGDEIVHFDAQLS